jgi:DNA-binding protein Fis
LSEVTLQDLEAAAILNAMNGCDGDRVRAAATLGISVESLNIKLDGPA